MSFTIALLISMINGTSIRETLNQESFQADT